MIYAQALTLGEADNTPHPDALNVTLTEFGSQPALQPCGVTVVTEGAGLEFTLQRLAADPGGGVSSLPAG